MNNLRPLVYNVVSNYGLNMAGGPGVTGAPKEDVDSNQFFGSYWSNANTAVDEGFMFSILPMVLAVL